MKKLKIVSILTIIFILALTIELPISNAAETVDVDVNLTKLTYKVNGKENEITKYTRRWFWPIFRSL